MSDLRLLCMGDNHGNASSLRRVVDETEGEQFDFIIHVGDITNACRDGLEAGADQLASIRPLFEDLSERGELVYVWGNRDFEICMKGMGTRVDTHAETGSMPGTRVPTAGTVEIAGQDFTQEPDEVDEETILITHYFLPELLDDFAGRAYVSGHVHTGRCKNNVLNTAFLYRDGENGAKQSEGGYFIVEIDDGEIDVSLRSLGGLTRGTCPKHIARGVQFTPDNWRAACTFCYDEDDFYQEIIDSVQYRLEKPDAEISVAEITDVAIDRYQGAGVPRDFERQLTAYAEENL